MSPVPSARTRKRLASGPPGAGLAEASTFDALPRHPDAAEEDAAVFAERVAAIRAVKAARGLPLRERDRKARR